MWDETSRLWGKSPSGGLLSNTYTYDKAFNVKTVMDNLGTLMYNYDHLNRLTSTTGAYVSSYGYNEIGNMRVKEENKTVGTAAETGSQCTDELDYDGDSAINDGCTATFSKLCYKPGELTPPDPPGCTTGLPHALKSAEGVNPAFKPGTGLEPYISTAFRSTYSYDASGNLTQVWGKNHVTDPNSDGALGKLMTAEYDAEGRLLRIPYNKLDTVAGGMAFYDVTGDCKYSTSDIVAMGNAYNKSIPDPLYNPLYDYNMDGRVNIADIVAVGDTNNTRCPTFIYDHTGQLARIEGRQALSGTLYGPYDRLYIGGVYEKALKTGEVTKYYSLGGRRVAMSKGATVSYLANDHLGGTSLVMNASGAQVDRMRYYPYGQTWTQTWSGTTPPKTDKLFTGHTRLGARSGMYYAGARFYSADLGRFMSADSIVPGAGDPQALNRYAYVRGNPLRFNDPTGHRWMDMPTERPHPIGWSPRPGIIKRVDSIVGLDSPAVLQPGGHCTNVCTEGYKTWVSNTHWAADHLLTEGRELDEVPWSPEQRELLWSRFGTDEVRPWVYEHEEHSNYWRWILFGGAGGAAAATLQVKGATFLQLAMQKAIMNPASAPDWTFQVMSAKPGSKQFGSYWNLRGVASYRGNMAPFTAMLEGDVLSGWTNYNVGHTHLYYIWNEWYK